MHLRMDLDSRFRSELYEFEEKGKMPYVTSIERLAKADVYLMQLEEICQSVPEALQSLVRGLSNDQLQKLGKDLLRFQSLADLETWLDQHASSAN
jgi:hypothetical protein